MTASPIDYSAAVHEGESRRRRRGLLWVNPAWLCVGAAFILSLVGLLAIGTTHPELVLKQAVLLCLGLGVAAMVAVPHTRWLQKLSVPLMVVVLILLVILLVPGVPEQIVRPRHGARRWINLGLIDMQPSELAKIAVVLLIASWLRFRENHRHLPGLLPPLLVALIPMGLILLQPDLGTALLFLPVCFAMLFAAGARTRHLLVIVLLGVIGGAAMTPMLRPHQRDRIEAMWAQFRGDDRFENDIGYQGARSMMLVGAGGVAGVGGEMASSMLEWNHLPEEHNDMIFAVICTRWGVLGAVLTWALYGLVLLGGLATAAFCRDPFGRLIAVGLVVALLAQMVINTGMTIGLMPITGMTLPFVSYGGSSLIVAWIMIGLIFGVALRRPPLLWRHSFEFDRVSTDES
ncbi:MAG: FtsW/RodA/SpoVE family cell cycle protein [Phycisphaerales bacterium]|nr:FtsW/RodA/SpoVE family cell cycle protein [Phycisphaerales bacterium]